ncbi:cytochrome-c peroxidase [Melittangium boletus]|uniref:Cytochrome c551 peroxidase n=1 Tax=Melittangium boletus DSM 14713 TaxID=1294270 RepID=A0A250IJF1_9BACT|nr:cytochrome-c peroxidase [Melittangium boletus]ATB31895.1 cytochrome c551 peroxidase [Melittangium boletus DSM 14713]
MMRSRLWLGVGLVSLGSMAVSCSKESPAPAPAAAPAPTAAAPAPTPPPEPARPQMSHAKLVAFFRPAASQAAAAAALAEAAKTDSPERIALGRMLFFENRLSKNHDISCNSCHDLASFGVDGKATSLGHKGQKGSRNSPTVFHAAGHVAQFWDGRAATLEEQAAGPMMNPMEMAMPDEKRLLATLNSIPEYVRAFKAAYPKDKKPVSVTNAARSIASFERGLITTSRFDKFLAGDEQALSEQERRGLDLFAASGCTTCHNGPSVGGTSFQKLGLIEEYPTEDKGRFGVTKNEEDMHKFRVPTLRNVEKTGPWFHDGSVTELPEAVRLMAKHQLGMSFTEPEVEDIVAFLKSLTGELPGADVLTPPTLPPSTRTTPKPDPT